MRSINRATSVLQLDKLAVMVAVRGLHLMASFGGARPIDRHKESSTWASQSLTTLLTLYSYLPMYELLMQKLL
jgi:hypothetical protein